MRVIDDYITQLKCGINKRVKEESERDSERERERSRNILNDEFRLCHFYFSSLVSS